MSIAVLGWGSLIWDPGDLQIAGEWMRGGPVLSIELSRISDNGRLTLVVDETDGIDAPTRYALSSLTDLEGAVANLQKREGTPHRSGIGFVDLVNDRISARASAKHPVACERIRTWARERKLNGVVWTAIDPRFEEKAGEPFSVNAAVRYLSQLSGEIRVSAFEYIRNAPGEVMTPVRRRAEMEFGLSDGERREHVSCLSK